MVCEKCGAQLNEEYEICPKCGNRVKKKIGLGKILGITFPVVLIGAGVFLYVSGYYRNILTQFGTASEETVTASTDVGDGNIVAEVVQNDPVQEETAEQKENDNNAEEVPEEVPEEPDMLTQYITELTIEPVEMTMGESHLVELEQEIPNAVWSSSDETVVLVEESKIKALMPGNATVTLSTDVKDISFDVTVNSFPDITLAVNYSTTMEINDAISDVSWESSVPEIVSVEDGVITSLTSGASNITAYIGEVPYTFEVVATTPDITTTSVRKIIGNTEQVSILGTNGKAEWKSDNTAIATVSDTGLITAEPTGAGQSTVIHAYIDGMEFKIDVAVEPIPQLSSTYKIYGYQNSTHIKNAKVTICTNANETVTYKDGKANKQSVLNVAEVDYSEDLTFPLYHAFSRGAAEGVSTYADVYLVGTSQMADVIIQNIKTSSSEDQIILEQSNSDVVYEPCENYGIIHIYYNGGSGDRLVTVSIDGYQYQFIVTPPTNIHSGSFSYFAVDELPADYMVEEFSVDEIIVQEKINVNYSTLTTNFRTYFGGDDWVERIGTKFVEAVEDEAISMAAGYLLKAIFL